MVNRMTTKEILEQRAQSLENEIIRRQAELYANEKDLEAHVKAYNETKMMLARVQEAEKAAESEHVVQDG